MRYPKLLLLLLMVQFSNAQLLPIKYTDSTQNLNGFLIKPVKKNKENPGILILPAWMGIDKLATDTAKKISDMGYHSFIADIYGEGNYPKDSKEAGQQAGFYKKNPQEYQKRIQLALEQLIKGGANPDKIVVIGYCFGGTGALEAVRGQLNVAGAVSFHGGLGKDPNRTTANSKSKILICHGADDPFVPQKDIDTFIQEMRTAKMDWQMIFYANAVHSFTNPEAGNDNSKGAAYNSVAAKRSFEALKQFLKETL